MKNYSNPMFEFVKTNEANKVFFEGSGPVPPVPPTPTKTVTGALQSMGVNTGAW